MRKTPAPENTIEKILSEHRIIVCVGAGGVGKTTLAAAIAVRAARSGKRVVCLTIDPARRLAESLGVRPDFSSSTIQDISHLLGEGVPEHASLAFGMLDPRKTFAEIVRNKTSSEEAANRILTNKLYRYVSGSLSGMHEYMALEQLAAIRDNPDYELIVLDTPPTTNAIDFFTAPRRMIEALDGKLVRLMRRAYGRATRVGFDLWNRWMNAVLKVLGVFTGADLLREIMAFVDALSDLFGSFSERAKAVEIVLHGPEVAFCLITTPDRATLRETRDFKNRLALLGLRVNAVIFNCAHYPRVQDPPNHLPADVLEKIHEINDEWNHSHDAEDTFIQTVRKGWEGLESMVIVPRLPEDATRVKSLFRLADYL